MAKLIVGCGYVGTRVASRWIDQGETVFAVTRSRDRAREFVEWGISPIIGDVTQGVQLQGLTDIETVLYAVGFDRSGNEPMEEVYVGGLERVLAALPESTGRIIYVSSTGVYGQSNGEAVDETSACSPTRRGGQICLRAEEALMSHRYGNRAIILRLAGIYGPGRVPKQKDVADGRELSGDPDSSLNLIHVDDVVQVILAAEASERIPRLYLVSDGHPVLRGDFYRHLAGLIGAEPVQFTPADPGSTTAARATSNKQILNHRMLEELRIQLRYPSYLEGLAAIIRP